MSFNPTPAQLVLIALLFTAVITAHIVAPLSVNVIISMASTLIAFLCNSPLKKPATDANEEEPKA
jgi:hypothetical protein